MSNSAGRLRVPRLPVGYLWPKKARPGLNVPVRVQLPEVRQDPEVEVQEVVEKEIIPKRLIITTRELEKYGFTPGCRACERKRRGELAKTRHSVVCRSRVEEKMNQDEQGKATLDATKQKFAKFTARLIEKEEVKKRKAETQAGNVDDMAIEDDKAEDAEVEAKTGRKHCRST